MNHELLTWHVIDCILAAALHACNEIVCRRQREGKTEASYAWAEVIMPMAGRMP